MNTALADILTGQAAAFAILRRPSAAGADTLDVLVGDVSFPEQLTDIPAGCDQNPVLALIPFRQITERGFDCIDDGSPLIAMTVTHRSTLPLSKVINRLPDEPTALTGGRFDPPDPDYADAVDRVVRDEIGRGEGANFVLKRSFQADIPGYSVRSALTLFRRLLQSETGAYWTFIVHTGTRTLVGASPERHATLAAGKVMMNPISGTYRYPPAGPSLAGVMDFLADTKEADELTMVVDEELKMMARMCDPGVRMVGPRYLEMAHLAHTEYLLEGHTTLDPRDILRHTLFAPTVTGSPLQNACRMIKRYETRGRGYYSGVAALIGRDNHGRPSLDSAIVIRTADIDPGGTVDIGVGSTIVRNSQAGSEVAETHAKAAALRAAFETSPRQHFGEHPDVRAALGRRNDVLADFWQLPSGADDLAAPGLAGLRVLVVDAEDTFTAMLGHQLTSLGLAVTIRRHDDLDRLDDHDLVVLGPGPGDPCRDDDPKIAHLTGLLEVLCATRTPFLAICLSHQVLSRRLGLAVDRLAAPNQGVQTEIDLFGVREHVGFYNTFAAHCDTDHLDHPELGPVQVSRHRDDGEVYALRGPRMASLQFHPESVLTREGPRILRDQLQRLTAQPRDAPLATLPGP